MAKQKIDPEMAQMVTQAKNLVSRVGMLIKVREEGQIKRAKILKGIFNKRFLKKLDSGLSASDSKKTQEVIRMLLQIFNYDILRTDKVIIESIMEYESKIKGYLANLPADEFTENIKTQLIFFRWFSEDMNKRIMPLIITQIEQIESFQKEMKREIAETIFEYYKREISLYDELLRQTEARLKPSYALDKKTGGFGGKVKQFIGKHPKTIVLFKITLCASGLLSAFIVAQKTYRLYLVLKKAKSKIDKIIKGLMWVESYMIPHLPRKGFAF